LRNETEGAFKLKRTLLLLLMAVAAAGLMTLPAAGQVNPEAAPSSEQGSPTFKYTGYAGFAYTSLNQVNQSRYGLIGGKFSLTRNLGKYFGVSGIVDYYKPPLSSASPGNPGDPSVYTFMVAPELHANLYEQLSGLFFAEVGGEHTGGEQMQPSISFAGGFGGGLEWALTSRIAVRAEGDRVAGSFTLTNDLPGYGYSTHRTWNARGSIGLVYHF
jgi:opacity protein-like surface antigen